MSQRTFVIAGFVLGVFLHEVSLSAEDAESLTAEGKRQEIRRLMNLFKKAPQENVSHQALQALYRLGVEHQEIATAIVLDYHLLDRDEKVRFRTSMLIARGKFPPFIVAAQNLRNLIAAETNPDLIWTHAVALSSIDSSAGSALELIQSIEHDSILHKALWDEKAQENQAIALGSLSIRLRLKKNQPPGQKGTVSEQVAQANPPATADDAKSREEQLLESFGIDPARAEEPTYRYSFDVGIRNPRPAHAPPQKIPAHPLIASQRFDEILRLMDQHSEEAWELFRLFGDSFPAEKVAGIYVPQAISGDVRDRGLAMKALWYAGPDAELAAALCYAVSHDLCVAHQVEMLERIELPGPYSEEAIRQLRNHENARVRKAVLEAMARSPELNELLFGDIQKVIDGRDPALKVAAIGVIGEYRSETTRGEEICRKILLEEDDTDVLSAAASVIRNNLMPRDFQRQIYMRIDPDNPTGNHNKVLINFLLNQVALESQEGKELRIKIEHSMIDFADSEAMRTLEPELRAMIKETKAIKREAQLEAIEQLQKLKLLD